jgi:hypothetical protein
MPCSRERAWVGCGQLRPAPKQDRLKFLVFNTRCYVGNTASAEAVRGGLYQSRNWPRWRVSLVVSRESGCSSLSQHLEVRLRQYASCRQCSDVEAGHRLLGRRRPSFPTHGTVVHSTPPGRLHGGSSPIPRPGPWARSTVISAYNRCPSQERSARLPSSRCFIGRSRPGCRHAGVSFSDLDSDLHTGP